VNWFRHYTSSSFDPKFRTAARRASSTIERVAFVFWALCERASEDGSGAIIKAFDPEPLADHLGCNVTDVTAIVTALRGLVHDGEVLTAWSTRQYVSDSSADRVKRWRERQKGKSNVNTLQNVTCNASEQSRAEQTLREKPPLTVGSKSAPPNGVAAPPKSRGSRFDPAWIPTAEYVLAARVLGLSDKQISDAADEFLDYWIAQPGSKGVKLDWLATWRNWCRRDRKFAAPKAQAKFDPFFT